MLGYSGGRAGNPSEHVSPVSIEEQIHVLRRGTVDVISEEDLAARIKEC
jgi:hypothetical protein